MTSRWREENYFRYARAHFALDALDSYAVTPDDPDRKVPNPAKKAASAAVSAAKKDLAAAETARQDKLAALRSPAPGTTTMITSAALARLDAPVGAARRKLGTAQAAARAVPAKIPLWSPRIFVDISIMLLLVSNCQIGARNPLGLSCRADVVSGRDCNIARCSRTRRS